MSYLPIEKKLLSIKETAYSLSLSTKTVRNLVKRGLLKPNRTTAKLMFPLAEIDRFVDS